MALASMSPLGTYHVRLLFIDAHARFPLSENRFTTTKTTKTLNERPTKGQPKVTTKVPLPPG